MPASNKGWNAIFKKYFLEHDFDKGPAILTADMIKDATRKFRETRDREPRVLAKIDCREDLPTVLGEKGLFVLPITNGEYYLIKGEGYADIPSVESEVVIYNSKLDFPLDTASVGDSEMQHLDFAYAVSLLRTFMEDPTLVLTIRGRKHTPKFSFKVGNQAVEVDSVQTEVDGGYEGKDKIVLVEAKNSTTRNTIIRQLFYPFKQWQLHSKKPVYTLFFEKDHGNDAYSFWQFEFTDPSDYNSIKLVKSARYKIQ